MPNATDGFSAWLPSWVTDAALSSEEVPTAPAPAPAPAPEPPNHRQRPLDRFGSWTAAERQELHDLGLISRETYGRMLGTIAGSGTVTAVDHDAGTLTVTAGPLESSGPYEGVNRRGRAPLSENLAQAHVNENRLQALVQRMAGLDSPTRPPPADSYVSSTDMLRRLREPAPGDYEYRFSNLYGYQGTISLDPPRGKSRKKKKPAKVRPSTLKKIARTAAICHALAG